MKILDSLQEGAIIAELSATDKKGVLEELTAPIAEATGVSHEEMVRVLLEREHLGSTGVGGGIAIPHGKSKSLQSLLMGRFQAWSLRPEPAMGTTLRPWMENLPTYSFYCWPPKIPQALISRCLPGYPDC